MPFLFSLLPFLASGPAVPAQEPAEAAPQVVQFRYQGSSRHATLGPTEVRTVLLRRLRLPSLPMMGSDKAVGVAFELASLAGGTCEAPLPEPRDEGDFVLRIVDAEVLSKRKSEWTPLFQEFFAPDDSSAQRTALLWFNGTDSAVGQLFPTRTLHTFSPLRGWTILKQQSKVDVDSLELAEVNARQMKWLGQSAKISLLHPSAPDGRYELKRPASDSYLVLDNVGGRVMAYFRQSDKQVEVKGKVVAKVCEVVDMPLR